MKLNKMNVSVNGRRMEVTVERQIRKTISLGVESAGGLYVKAPPGMTDKRILEFIEARERWLTKRLGIIERSKAAGIGSGLVPGRILYFMGRPRTLEISGSVPRLLDDTLTVPEFYTIRHLEEWYRMESQKAVDAFIRANRDRIPPCTFRIRQQKRIWGSCSAKRNININSRISMCRPSAIEYILWHEICHLEHMDHSDRFYRHLGTVFPDYRAEKKWLTENAGLLGI